MNDVKRSVNGYPQRFIDYHSKSTKISAKSYDVPKKKIVLKLPYKGEDIRSSMHQQLSKAIRMTFNAASLLLISTTRKLPVKPIAERLSVIAMAHCLYKLMCSCGCSSLGRTDRTLSKRIFEHIPKWLRSHLAGTTSSS